MSKAEGFDYKTSVKDPKTGKEIGRKDYKLELAKNEHGETTHKIESPIGSGNYFHPNGEKIEIVGDIQKKVPIDANGKTEEEFHKEQAPKQAAKKPHAVEAPKGDEDKK